MGIWNGSKSLPMQLHLHDKLSLQLLLSYELLKLLHESETFF